MMQNGTKNQQEPTRTNKNQQEPTRTNKNQQEPTRTNKNQQEPTNINKHQQAPASINKHQQAPKQKHQQKCKHTLVDSSTRNQNQPLEPPRKREQGQPAETTLPNRHMFRGCGKAPAWVTQSPAAVQMCLFLHLYIECGQGFLDLSMGRWLLVLSCLDGCMLPNNNPDPFAHTHALSVNWSTLKWSRVLSTWNLRNMHSPRQKPFQFGTLSGTAHRTHDQSFIANSRKKKRPCRSAHCDDVFGKIHLHNSASAQSPP